MKQYKKTSIKKSLILYLITVTLFSLLNYQLFIRDFTILQEDQNKNSIDNLLTYLENELQRVETISSDYARWDDTYNFVQDSNTAYIHENFGETVNTLESLNVDFMIFQNKQSQTVYSEYNQNELSNHQLAFEKKLSMHFSDEKVIFVKLNDSVIYITRSKITKSDKTGEFQGYLYSGKVLTNALLHENIHSFDMIKITFNKSLKYQVLEHRQYLKNLKINTRLLNKKVKNSLDFYDNKDKYIFTIATFKPSNIINNGKETIMIFNLIISMILLCIFIVIHRKQNQLKKANMELFELSYRDTLTKINNRRSYFENSEILLKKAIKYEKEFAVLMIDLDNFKKINDHYGHSVGDKVLIAFTREVNKIIDDKAVFGRIGGEEFCISFYGIAFEKVIEISETIRKQCESTPLEFSNQTIHYTISLGLSERGDLTNIDKILRQSDELLYQAKDSGRNKLIRCHGK